MIAHFWLIFPPRNVLFAYGLSYARKRLSVLAFIFGLLFFSYDVIQICTFSNSMLSTKKCIVHFPICGAFSGQNATIRLLEIPKTFRYSYCISNFVEQQFQIFILTSIQCMYSIKFVKSCENTIGIVFKHYCQVVPRFCGYLFKYRISFSILCTNV